MLHRIIAATILSGVAVFPALAQDVQLPRSLVWTSFDVGSSGYNQSIAIGKALQDAYGIQLRVLPTSTDQSRLVPARDGRVPFALSGSDVFYASEGVLGYASPDWGPQPIGALSIVGAENCADLGVAADAGIETIADVAGKRVGKVVGSPALQANVRAFLAFGGLTEDDVQMVELPSYAAAWQALANGQIDAMTGVTSGGVIEQAAAGPRGLFWVPLPHDDEEGWARMQAVNPHFSKAIGTVGANLSADRPLECAGVPYPVLIAYDGQVEDSLIYNLTMAIDLQVENFMSAEPAAGGWAGEEQIFDWVVPYADGAIEYWIEAGLWTDEMQAHNDGLRERQQVLADAWSQMDGVSGNDFAGQWMEVRAAALNDAGLPVYFE